MISRKDLTEHKMLTGYSVVDTDGIVTLNNAREIIGKKMKEYGINIEITDDQIKSGNILKSSYQDCIVITNTNHPTDYFKYVISIRRQGNVAFIDTYMYGTSKLFSAQYSVEQRNANGGLFGKLLNKITGPDEAALQEEEGYYAIVNGCLKALLK